MRARLLSLVFVAGCVKGDPIDLGMFVNNGGSLAIDGCGYTLSTYPGAEAPMVALAAFGTDPTPKNIHLGLMGDPKTSMVAQWRTNDDTTRASSVRFGVGANLTADQLTTTVQGIEFGYQGTGGSIYRVHQGHLCGLSPATTYSYQVGGEDLSGNSHYSPIFTFHTAPDVSANPDTAVVLGFVGDSRGGYDVWQQLITELQTRTPDLILFSGDAVTFGITQDEWEDFFSLAQPLFANVPMIAADGNHEANAVNFYSQVAMPGDQQDYGVDYGFAHITVGNDSPDDPSAITGAARDAIAADFAASQNAQWKIFMHHQPIFSASTRHGSSVTLQNAWQPVIDQYHIDLVLNGHDHDYEVTKPMVGMNPQPSSTNATVYIVAGGAGAELYPNGTGAWTQYSESTYSAATINVREGQLDFEAFRQDGSAIPTGFTKTKP